MPSPTATLLENRDFVLRSIYGICPFRYRSRQQLRHVSKPFLQHRGEDHHVSSILARAIFVIHMQKTTKPISNWPAPTTNFVLDLTTGEARETKLPMVFEVEAADLSFERCLFSRQRCCVESISAACHVLVDSNFPLSHQY